LKYPYSLFLSLHLHPMRVLVKSDGTPMCYDCGRPFDVHPTTKRRQELHAALCAIKDDDHAARAFHYHLKLQEEMGQQQEMWVERHGYDHSEVGNFGVDGVSIRLVPGVSVERAMEVIDQHILPSLRAEILKTLDGTAQKEAENFKAEIEELVRSGKQHVYDPIWCPDTPAAQELYPNGYVRKEDGSVEAL
jgi:hypothetical protein